MKKLLFQTDSSLAKTGFGRNAKALLSYLYKTKKYEIVQYCCGTAYSEPSLQRTPWKSIGTLPDDPNERHRISQDAGQARIASYGGYLIDKVMKEEKPDFYFGVQDIWGTEFAISQPWFNKIHSTIWTTLDSLPILPSALTNAPKIKNYWIWSSFATKALNELGHSHVNTMHGCIDTKHFHRLKDEERLELRRKNNIEENAFIVGFVFRNQLRKSIPNLLEGYAKWKETTKPELSNKKPYLLLHTYWKEGWGIHKLAKEYGISESEILTTYVCKKCSGSKVKAYTGEDQTCETCGAEKSQVTTSVGFGVTEPQLNEVYNLMDVYCHPFTSGGQEIPIQEAKLAELITLVTNYSCGEEQCEEGSGSIPLEWTEYREHQTEFKKASTSPDSIAKGLDTVFQMLNSEKRKIEKKSRQWAVDNFSVEVIGKKFEEFIDSLDATNYDFEGQQPENQKRNFPDAYVPNIESDSEWVLTLYKTILSTDNHTNDDGYKTWMNSLSSNVPRSQIEEYFRKVARDHNAKFFPVKMEDLVSDDDEGKRIVYVMPDSSVDVFLSTSLFKSIKEKYPDYNLYVSTKQEYYHILQGDENIHKVIPYSTQFDASLAQEGVGENKGLFEIVLSPYLTTQKINNYIHNGKDKINTESLCTF